MWIGTVLSGCGSPPDAAAPAAPKRHVDGAHAFTVAYPVGWHRARRNLAPAVVDPRQVLTLASGDLGPCAMGPRDVQVTLSERRNPNAYADAPPRRVSDMLPGDAYACPADTPRQLVATFRAGGRSFLALLAVGRDAPASRRAAGLAVLQSLRPQPPFIDHERRLTAVIPRGWRTQGAVVFDGDLAIGSYPVRANRPPGGCVPRTLRELPPDGALMLIIEYGVSRRSGPVPPPDEHDFQRGRPLARDALREPLANYECFGRSRMIRWRERGRLLQAHLYLGPRAGAATRRGLAAVFDSLRYRR